LQSHGLFVISPDIFADISGGNKVLIRFFLAEGKIAVVDQGKN
jgi:hypothetical protein